jgi:hypothetical protein
VTTDDDPIRRQAEANVGRTLAEYPTDRKWDADMVERLVEAECAAIRAGQRRADKTEGGAAWLT